MTVYDLNRDQLTELKQQYYEDEVVGYSLSYDELANIDSLVSDEEIYKRHEGTYFVPDDFASSAGRDEEDIIDYDLEVSGQADKYELADDLRQIASAIEDGYYSGLANNGTTWSIS